MEGQLLVVNHQNNEISLLDLFNKIWKKKWLIVTSSFIGLLFSTAYLSVATPVYEAKAYIVPPLLQDINSLNQGRYGSNNSGPLEITPKQVFKYYINTLTSEKIRRLFFKQIYLPLILNQQKTPVSENNLYHSFSANISIMKDKQSILPSDKYIVTIRSNSQETSYDWAKKYIDLATKEALVRISNTINAQNLAFSNNIKQRITAIIEVARQKRFDTLEQLTEAFNISKAIGLENPVKSNSTSLNTLLYMRGSKALAAEIQVIKARKTDKPFALETLRTLENEYNYYSKLLVPMNDVKMYRLDGFIDSPDIQISPRKMLILLQGMIAGLILGILTVLLRSALD